MRIRQKAAVAGIFTLLSAVIVAGPASAAPGAQAGVPPRGDPSAASGAPAQPQAAPKDQGPADRATTPNRDLAKGWKSSQDRAVTLAPDADGLHVLVADSKDAYAWHTVTTLSEAGFDTDLWIGNSCLADRAHAFVVYAPRGFTNTENLMERGAFTAVVDLDTGAVRKLPLNGTLAYFDPTCDTASHTAVFTQVADDSTRLVTVGTDGRTVATTTAAGEITSAVPSGDGLLAADGHHVVRIDRQGRKTTVATTSGVPSAIHQDSGGGVDFLDQTATVQSARRTAGGRTRVLATGATGALGLNQGLAGQVFLTGTPRTTAALPSQIRRVAAPAGTDLSTEGRLSVAQAVSPACTRTSSTPSPAPAHRPRTAACRSRRRSPAPARRWTSRRTPTRPPPRPRGAATRSPRRWPAARAPARRQARRRRPPRPPRRWTPTAPAPSHATIRRCRRISRRPTRWSGPSTWRSAGT